MSCLSVNHIGQIHRQLFGSVLELHGYLDPWLQTRGHFRFAEHKYSQRDCSLSFPASHHYRGPSDWDPVSSTLPGKIHGHFLKCQEALGLRQDELRCHCQVFGVQERQDLSRHSSPTHRLFMSISAQLLQTLVCIPKFFVLEPAHWMGHCWLQLEAQGLCCFSQEHYLLSQLMDCNWHHSVLEQFAPVLDTSQKPGYLSEACSFHNHVPPKTQPVILPSHPKAYPAEGKEIPQTEQVLTFQSLPSSKGVYIQRPVETSGLEEGRIIHIKRVKQKSSGLV